MSSIKDGGPGDLPPVEVKCPNDEFENAIRKIGVVAACEWFDHAFNSSFTAESIKVLRDRSLS
jgi:hypothetical protein